MTKKCLLVLGTLALAAVPAGAGPTVSVRADPARLSWSLFRRVDSIPGSSEDARLGAKMSFPQPLRIERIGDRYRMPPFTITVTPEPERTMLRRSAPESPALLDHEQGHYDIVMLAARALARDIEAATADSAGELSRKVKGLVDEHTMRAERLSEAYDHDTGGSREIGRAHV